MEIKTNLKNKNNFDITFDLMVYQFANGLLMTSFSDFDNVELRYQGKLLPQQVFDNAIFFSLTTQSVQNADLELTVFKNTKHALSYQLVTNKPFKPLITANDYEKLTDSLKENYQKSDNEKIVKHHFIIADNILDFADVIDEDFGFNDNESFNIADNKIYDLSLVTTFVHSSQFVNKNLFQYMALHTQAMISAKGIVSFLVSLNDVEKPTWFGYSRNKTPRENEMFTMSVGTHDDSLILNYWDKPYHPEYKTVHTLKKNGQLYADNRTHQEIVPVKPVSSLVYEPTMIYSRNLIILFETLTKINDKLTLKQGV